MTNTKEKAIEYINLKITVLKVAIEEVEPILEFKKLTGDLPPDLSISKKKSYRRVTPGAILIGLKKDLSDWEAKLEKID